MCKARNYKKLKDGNLTFVMMTMLVSMLLLTTIVTLTMNGLVSERRYKKNMDTQYEAESAVDMACYVIENKIKNEVKFIGYTKVSDDKYELRDRSHGIRDNDGYILNELDMTNDYENLRLGDVENAVMDYLGANGSLEFKNNSTIQIEIKVPGLKDDLRLSNLITTTGNYYDFMIGDAHEEEGNSGRWDYRDANLGDVGFEITVDYDGGVIKTDAILSGVKIWRSGFKYLEDVGDTDWVECTIDTRDAKWKFTGYKNN